MKPAQSLLQYADCTYDVFIADWPFSTWMHSAVEGFLRAATPRDRVIVADMGLFSVRTTVIIH